MQPADVNAPWWLLRHGSGMPTPYLLLLALLAWCLAATLHGSSLGGVANSGGDLPSATAASPRHAEGSQADFRIAYSCDGNQHDADDWHASALALAMIAEAGLSDRLVHFDYNNHLGDNAQWRAETHRRVVADAVRRYGYDPARFHDDQQDLAGAVAGIASAIDASSPEDRLFLLCAGPMEVCWRGIDAASDHQEPLVTVISHGRWNESHADTPELRHTWADIQRDFDVVTRQIGTQNATAFRSAPSAWGWLRQVRHGEWLHAAVAEGRKAGDASDAGMVYYLIDGRRARSDRATMSDIRARFGVP